MSHQPDFIIIGAMKCATTTVYDQLKLQPGIFLPELKEPNFFSDNDQFSHGMNWYSALFDDASDRDILGEASTHYTKLPTYPDTIQRMQGNLKSLKFIYIMRHPIERLISHYIHEWTQGNISVEINLAIELHPELIAYSRYAYQLRPYIHFYGKEALLPVFFENLKETSQHELERICHFIGYRDKPLWHSDLLPANISRERIRRFPLYNLLIESLPAQFLRRSLIPESLRERMKRRFQMRERPILSQDAIKHLQHIFDDDLLELGEWLGVTLECQNYRTVVTRGNLGWKL